MEMNPSIDYGMPGPLVHFVETYFGRGYEQKLVDSVRRRPTEHTLWMLNRVINGAYSREAERHFIDVLREASKNELVDAYTQGVAASFLEGRQTPE